MKKYLLIMFMFLINLITYNYAQGDTKLYFIIKYGFSDLAIRIALSAISNFINLMYMYICIYQYEFLKENIVIRLGKKGYILKISGIYLKNILIFVLINLLIDIIISHEINILYLFVSSIIFLFPLVYLKLHQKNNSYFLFLSYMIIILLKLGIFSLV